MPMQLEAPVQPEAPTEPKGLIEPEAPVQGAEEATAKPIGSDTKSDRGEEMVARKTMTISHFVPSARPTAHQQPPQGRG